MYVLTLMMTAGNVFEMFFDGSTDAHDELDKLEGEGEFNIHDDYGARFVGSKALIAMRMVIDLTAKYEATLKCETLKMNAQRRFAAGAAAKPPLVLANAPINGQA